MRIQRSPVQFGYITPEETQAQGISGRGGTLTSLISELAGTGGAAGGAALGASLGSVVPGIGTIIGGAVGGLAGGFAGGFGGRAVENKVRDDDWQLSKALGEGLMSGAFGTLGGAARGFSVGKALKNFDKLDDAAKAAMGLDDLGKVGSKMFSPSQIKQIEKAGKGITAIKGMTKSQSIRAKNFGIKLGDKVGDYKIDAASAKNLMNFADDGAPKYLPGGFGTGSPSNLANKAVAIKDNVTQALVGSLDDVNRTVTATEKAGLIDKIQKAVASSARITTKEAKSANKLIEQIMGATDVKALELVRQNADDLIYSVTSGSPLSSSAAAQATIVRNALDDFVTNQLDDVAAKAYKSVKGDYRMAKILNEVVAKNAGKVKGLPVPLMSGLNAPVSGAANVARSFGGGALGLADKMPSLPAALAGVAPSAGQLARGTVGRGLANQLTSPIGQPVEGATQDMGGDAMAMGGFGDISGMGMPQANPVEEMYPQANLMADIQRDPANAAKYIEYYSLLQETFAPQTTDAYSNVGVVSAKDLSNAQLGLSSLAQLSEMIASDPNIVSRTATPGRQLPIVGGYVSRAAGVSDYDALGYNIADTILRIRTGAQANESEIRNLQSQLMPRAGDSQETVQFKMNQNYNRLQPIVDMARGGSGQSDLAAILGGI